MRHRVTYLLKVQPSEQSIQVLRAFSDLSHYVRMPISANGTRLKDLATPAFVINRNVLEKNCQRALDRARHHGMKLRPHIKTHKTIEGAFVQATGLGLIDSKDGISPENLKASLVSGFVASTLPEVALLANAAAKLGGPFQDILYGVPISKSRLARLDSLRQKIPGGKIHILVDHSQQVADIEAFAEERGETCAPWSTFLKLDTGYHRAGVPCDHRGLELAARILASDDLNLIGVYSHCGHAYDENDPDKLDAIAESDLEQIKSFLEQLEAEQKAAGRSFSLEDLTVSVGSTPSLAHHTNAQKMSGLEIHPGNYTLYDRQQVWTGACKEEDVACRVISRVIGHYEDRNTIMLDAGATALTKESTPQGGMCALGGYPELECYKMSQEVTLVRPKDPNTLFPFADLPIGSTVDLLPNHSCLAAACFEKYSIIQNDNYSFAPDEAVIEEWIPAKFF